MGGLEALDVVEGPKANRAAVGVFLVDDLLGVVVVLFVVVELLVGEVRGVDADFEESSVGLGEEGVVDDLEEVFARGVVLDLCGPSLAAREEAAAGEDFGDVAFDDVREAGGSLEDGVGEAEFVAVEVFVGDGGRVGELVAEFREPGEDAFLEFDGADLGRLGVHRELVDPVVHVDLGVDVVAELLDGPQLVERRRRREVLHQDERRVALHRVSPPRRPRLVVVAHLPQLPHQLHRRIRLGLLVLVRILLVVVVDDVFLLLEKNEFFSLFFLAAEQLGGRFPEEGRPGRLGGSQSSQFHGDVRAPRHRHREPYALFFCVFVGRRIDAVSLESLDELGGLGIVEVASGVTFDAAGLEEVHHRARRGSEIGVAGGRGEVVESESVRVRQPGGEGRRDGVGVVSAPVVAAPGELGLLELELSLEGREEIFVFFVFFVVVVVNFLRLL
mmetsp:Transcript_36517/g.117066  ORF Transcript_36517/g.117066 Transcript_36517/m.117066 type:complete len:444 (-) Transcript_36517:11-1342(-)